LIPYEQPDLSPYERPLTDDELKTFAQDFSGYKSRAFALPYLNLTELFTANEKFLRPLRQFDRKVLQTIKPLDYYASIRIVEMTK